MISPVIHTRPFPLYNNKIGRRLLEAIAFFCLFLDRVLHQDDQVSYNRPDQLAI